MRWKPNASALSESRQSGKDPEIEPVYVFRNCTFKSADRSRVPALFTNGTEIKLEKCTFENAELRIEENAAVTFSDCTVDGKPFVQFAPPTKQVKLAIAALKPICKTLY